jgi:uncharacterized membrane protein
MLSELAPDEASAQAAVVGLFIFGILTPLMALGVLFSISAVLQLNHVDKIRAARLNTLSGGVLLAFGWLILGTTVTLIGVVIYTVLIGM